jgi:hypothetical protein
MTYAHVVDDAVVAVSSRPSNLRRIEDGAHVLWSEFITDEELAACGWFPVVDDPEPTFNPATHTVERNPASLVDGVPTRTWTIRPLTADELANRARAANTAAMTDLEVVKAKMNELKAFLTDPDLTAIENQANNTALATSTLNRFLKLVARQLRRDANFDIRLARLVIGQYQPTLLDDVSDV